MNEIYEFLETKGVSKDNINKIFGWYYKQKEEFDFVSKLENLYNIFNYAGLDNNQIEKLFANNLEIFKMNMNEIFSMAWVFKFSAYTDLMFNLDDKRALSSLSNYKRILIRTILFYQLKKEPSASVLLVGDKEAYGTKYQLNCITVDLYKIGIESDKELENTLNSILTVNDVPITIDEFIRLNVLKFSRKYFISRGKSARK